MERNFSPFNPSQGWGTADGTAPFIVSVLRHLRDCICNPTLSLPQAEVPLFSPSPGDYANDFFVTITSANDGALLYYTTDGSEPTVLSTRYTAPIAITATGITVKAIAVRDGLTNSEVGEAAYTLTTPSVQFSPVAGVYNTAQTVSLTNGTTGVAIHYTLDGTAPTESSALYSVPLNVSVTTTIRAGAYKTGYNRRPPASATYTIDIAAPTVATPTFSPVAGTYGAAQSVTISSATASVQIYYTTNGTTPTIASTLYTGPVTVATSGTLKALAVRAAYVDSAVGTAAYVINITVVAPVITFTPSTAQQYLFSDEVGFPVSYTWAMTTTTPGAAIYYLGGVDAWHDPVVEGDDDDSLLYTGPGSQGVSYNLKARAYKDGVFSTTTSAAHALELPIFYGWAAAGTLDQTALRALAVRVLRYNHTKTQPTFDGDTNIDYGLPAGAYVFSPGGAGSDYYYIGFPQNYPTPVTVKLGAFDVPMAGTAEGYALNDGDGGPNYMLVEADTGTNYKVMRTFNAIGGAATTLTLA